MKEKRSFTSANLKWIAIITMLIDHLAAGLLLPYIRWKAITVAGWFHGETGQFVYHTYYVLRGIGRLAFPLFCFMIVEGFYHTRNKWKYLGRLGLFCLISEIPFDLAFQHAVYYPEYQNVYFTLALGLLGIIVADLIMNHMPKTIWRYSLLVLSITGFALIAALLRTDYGACGVLLILVLYLLREKPVYRNILVMVVLFATGYDFDWADLSFSFSVKSGLLELVGAISLLFLFLYRGEKGKNLPKYFFYIFYPAHLLMIAGICYATIGF